MKAGARSAGRGTEAKRSREPVADLPQEQRLAREDPARISGEAPEESERSGVKRRRPDAFHAESPESRAQLTGGLVGEGDCDELVRGECAARHLPRDAARDRRGLTGAGAGEDADRAPHRVDRGALLVVQPFEDPSGVQGRPPYPGDRSSLSRNGAKSPP